MRKFHHYGVPTTGPIPNGRYIPHLGLTVGAYENSPYKIELMRFDANAPADGLIAAFIEEDGVPVELMQIDPAVFKG